MILKTQAANTFAVLPLQDSSPFVHAQLPVVSPVARVSCALVYTPVSERSFLDLGPTLTRLMAAERRVRLISSLVVYRRTKVQKFRVSEMS